MFSENKVGFVYASEKSLNTHNGTVNLKASQVYRKLEHEGKCKSNCYQVPIQPRNNNSNSLLFLLNPLHYRFCIDVLSGGATNLQRKIIMNEQTHTHPTHTRTTQRD